MTVMPYPGLWVPEIITPPKWRLWDWMSRSMSGRHRPCCCVQCTTTGYKLTGHCSGTVRYTASSMPTVIADAGGTWGVDTPMMWGECQTIVSSCVDGQDLIAITAADVQDFESDPSDCECCCYEGRCAWTGGETLDVTFTFVADSPTHPLVRLWGWHNTEVSLTLEMLCPIITPNVIGNPLWYYAWKDGGSGWAANGVEVGDCEQDSTYCEDDKATLRPFVIVSYDETSGWNVSMGVGYHCGIQTEHWIRFNTVSYTLGGLHKCCTHSVTGAITNVSTGSFWGKNASGNCTFPWANVTGTLDFSMSITTGLCSPVLAVNGNECRDEGMTGCIDACNPTTP